MRHILRYIADLWSGWVGVMSSSAAVILLILGLFLKLTEGFQSRYWLIASFACYAIASFSAWYRIRPDLSIEIQEVSMQALAFSWSHLDQLKSLITLKVIVVNTRPANNAITKYRLVVNAEKGKIEGSYYPTHGLEWRSTHSEPNDLGKAKHAALRQGEPMEGSICFALENVTPKELRGQRLVLIITDAYGVLEKIKGIIPLESEDMLLPKVPDRAFQDIL